LLLVNSDDIYISYKEYDKEILSIIDSFGFDRAGNVKYGYFSYYLNFQDEYIYKLVDKDYRDKSVESIGNEVLDMFKTVNKSSKLKKLLSK
jgi:hypothetical protein